VRANRLQRLPSRLTRTSPDLEDNMAGHGTAKTVDELLAQARAMLPHRPSPAEALHAQAGGALLMDIRGDDQRRDGLIPGAIVIPRNSLEWRCDPASQWRHPALTHRDLHIILICDQGYQSSLAAATLQQLGLIHATDLDGGFTAWAAAGLPVITPPPAAKTYPVTVTLTDHPAEPANDAHDNE
jgi:rhodanese-related sulfurtransferase